MKNISLPQPIVDAINLLEPFDRGLTFTAVFAFILGTEISVELTPAARATFEMAKIILAPRIERRRRAEERRRNRMQNPPAKPEHIDKQQDPEPEPYVPNKEHIEKMKKVVALAYRTRRTRRSIDEKIREELHQRYPGQYKDIMYDRLGHVYLFPVDAA